MDSLKQNYHRYIQFTGTSMYRRFIQDEGPKTPETAGTSKEIALETSSHGTYGAYLLHPRWKARRKEIIMRDHNRCVNCSSDKELQVHHRQYHFIVSQNQFRLPWEYPDHLLITLCQSCHNRGHNKYKVPTINV